MSRPRLTHRWASTACIVWLAGWFGVVVPGHERGRIVLPGYTAPPPAQSQARNNSPSHTGGESCCPVPREDSSPRPADPTRRCAICYIVATLTVPPPIDFASQPAERLERLEPDGSRRPTACRPVRLYLGRAPPVSA